MSLFPAYSETSKEPDVQPTKDPTDTEWLTNSSYSITLPSEKKEEENEIEIIEVKECSPHSPKAKRRKKEKKKHKRREREKSVTKEKIKKPDTQVEIIEDNEFYTIDKQRQLSYLTSTTLTRPLKPRYNIRFYGLVPHYVRKKMKNKRYFKFNDSSEGCKEGTLEEETIVSKKTEEFNKRLSEDSHDIQTWIEFVKFQDEFYKYQHIRYRSLIERDRAASQHKLSILDRAVSQNPENKELQALWLKIGSSVLPSEEMSSRINKILEDSGGTMTLWLGLMTTTQHSLARCTVPSVTKLYEKLLVNFQKVKQPDIYGRDLNVLELLFHYGRFLDNCGHWEILWLMIKVNLQFNAKVELNFNIDVDEKVKELENNVLEKEKQAVWQMWSKLERVREGLHFLPEDSVDYPQRCVTPETVVNFTWHFHPDLHFQLIVSFILLFKVPLLQATDTVLKFLVPNALPWVFDSPEFILSAVLTSPAVNLKSSYLSPITQLSRGPQYLRKFYGQLEFFSTISNTFEACLKCLEGRQRTALGVWWLRFERWIHLLNKLQLTSLPDGRKTAKSFFKDFLKVTENRDNLLFYIEYSLLEFNLGNTDACIKALNTLILSRQPVLNMSDKEEKEMTISAYRTLCEVLIGANQKKDALDLLINLGSGNALNSKVTILSLASAEKKFEAISVELISELESSNSCSLEDLLMPMFIIDWISCYFWLIALVKNPSELRNCYSKIFSLLEEHSGVIADQTRECLWETLVTIFTVVDSNNYAHNRDILYKSFISFPLNLKFLVFMADSDLQNNAYWWALKKTFLSSPTTFSCIFLICLALERFKKDKENFQNRVKNLFQSLALQEGKLTSMVHCLRLRFLFENENIHLETAQLQALESCPWNKSIYMESILLLPAKLMQLTDVLIEKELRIHITPDEIQEMRD